MSIDTHNIQTWIERELQRSDVRMVKELSGGNSNVTCLIESAQGAMVLRTPPGDAISPKADRGVAREARVMGALHGHVKVPLVLAWCEDNTVIGRPFALVEHIDGTSITEVLPDAYDGAAAINSLGLQLTDELAAIAMAPWQALGLDDIGRPENFLRRQIERWLDVRNKSPVRELPVMQQVGTWLLDHLPQDGPTGVVHGDYHLDNTLCSANSPQLLAVIDWEMATIGDPLTDLGLFLMFWGPRRVNPPGFEHVQAVTRIDGVSDRRLLAQRWSDTTGVPIDNLNYYLCFAFWRLAAIVEGAYGLYLDGKVDTPYARGLEYDVPALLEEARLAAEGEW